MTPRPELRRRRVCENDDYAAFTRRILCAHGRRIARGDIEGLTDLTRLADDVDTAVRHAVTGLRAAGFSWADIASRLGTTRQAAHQRYSSAGPS
ncbi:hypothetical protein [Pseudonocardia sp. NPDC046786]|uniref:hypothetical protein n=1 Tax=Pseudonocardia sp. NPDC046786 TaxID=3155471 RepID=UPI0033DDA6ED